ncbi:MAG: CRTAC1 family protein [Gemmatimonadota bacterium]
MRRAAGLGAAIAGLVLGGSPALAQGFDEVGREAGIDHVAVDPHRIAGGVAFFDYDGDGDDDLWLTGGRNPDRLYRNRGDGTFDDVTEAAGLGFLADIPTVGVVTGDIDNDGDRDVFVTTFEGYPNILLRNEGDGTFTDVSEAAGVAGPPVWSTAAAFGDYDLDGFLDLYVGNYATYDDLPYDEHLTGGIPNFLYRNRGDGTFEDVAERLGVDDPDGLALAVAFTDYDGDADVDIWVANDFGYLFEEDKLYRNDGGRFVEVGEELGVDNEINAMGIAAGDYDEDGDLDYYVTNMARNRLHENLQRGHASGEGSGRFVDVARQKGLDDEWATSWGAVFADVDNDGHLDLLLANGRVLPSYNMEYMDHLHRLVEPHANRLWRGDGKGGFVEVASEMGVADTTRGRGLAWSDIDGDGDVDLAVSVLVVEGPTMDHALLYRNEGHPGRNWLNVRLRGTSANRDAFGSRVRVVAAERSLIREIDGGSSYLSQSSSVAHFGLGSRAVADSLVVTWPGGKIEVLTDLPVNRTVEIVEGVLAAGEPAPETPGSESWGKTPAAEPAERRRVEP